MSAAASLSQRMQTLIKEWRYKKNHEDKDEGIDWNEGQSMALEEIIEELKPLVAGVAGLKAQVEHLETVFSELGIAFDDLRREKETEVKALKELADKWDKFSGSFREHKCVYGIIYCEKINAESRLAQAQGDILKAMVDFHCSTIKDFPDEAHCGSPKTKTCNDYYLCQAVKETLSSGGG